MAAKEGFVHPELLIETDALERQLGDPALRVFDCTTNRTFRIRPPIRQYPHAPNSRRST